MINYINIHYLYWHASTRIKSYIPFLPYYYLYFTHLLLINSCFSAFLPSRISKHRFLSTLNFSFTIRIPHYLIKLFHFIIKIALLTPANSSNTNFTITINYSPIITFSISDYAFKSKYYTRFNFPSELILTSFYFTRVHFIIFQFQSPFISKNGSILFQIYNH